MMATIFGLASRPTCIIGVIHWSCYVVICNLSLFYGAHRATMNDVTAKIRPMNSGFCQWCMVCVDYSQGFPGDDASMSMTVVCLKMANFSDLGHCICRDEAEVIKW